MQAELNKPRGPLSGIRVLDLTRVLAGPFCTMILGDLGAEIIKVEEINGGDQTRNIPPHVSGESHYFLTINRNKQSIALDARTPGGRDVLLDLVRHCDVLVENFRPGVMDRLGLGEARLREANRRLILCSISGYGQKTSLSEKPSFDLVAQALSGVMSINGEPDGPPTKLGLPMGDLGGGLWAAIAILSALQHRNATGEALTVDFSLLEGMIGMLGYLAQSYFVTGESPVRVGSSHQSVVPYGRFPTSDGHLVVALMVESFYVKFCAAIGHPEFATDPRFATTTARKQNRVLLEALVSEVMAQRSTAKWQAVFAAADIPCGPVNTVAEALSMPIVAEREVIQQIKHPTVGKMPIVRSPVRFAERFQDPAIQPAPLLGEHTTKILTDLLGYDHAKVEALIHKGAVQVAATEPM
ncbi:CaiB/BaiF CoA transferase family protein [Rhodopila sp.]|uniref:CaiB/BaiF CoA transferase family protein n=1 Tax=Rhodopila sp. TaxID=2480087 RepID=UPI002BE04C7D|nr:CoA transferase [Rhodopila sp.]HVZ06725.1 CoA transferase [Rhodopila sp.]